MRHTDGQHRFDVVGAAGVILETVVDMQFIARCVPADTLYVVVNGYIVRPSV